MIARPAHTRRMPITTESTRYRMNVVQSPLLPRTHMSSAKDENVVKPPQKPVISMTFSPGVMTCAFSNSPKRSPITKQPIMFTRNVPIGNAP